MYIYCVVENHGQKICRHGVKQPRNPWSDGPAYITQCPIQPGKKYSYRIHSVLVNIMLYWKVVGREVHRYWEFLRLDNLCWETFLNCSITPIHSPLGVVHLWDSQKQLSNRPPSPKFKLVIDEWIWNPNLGLGFLGCYHSV